MATQRFRAVVALIGAFSVAGCDHGKSPLQPTSTSAPQALSADTTGASGGTVVPWHCIASTSTWQPSDCPARAARGLRAGVAAITSPGIPGSLTASASGARVTLTWVAPSGGDAPSSYVVEAGSAAGRRDLADFDTGNATASLIADGVPAGTYFVRVRAKNAAGVSGESNEVVVTVSGTSCATAPGAPSGLSSLVAGSSLTLTWTAPSGACAPTSYSIEAGSTSGLSNLAVVNTGSSATSFSASGIGAGTYFVRLRAANANGQSGASNEISFSIGTTGLTACSTWAAQQRGAGVPAATGSVAVQRQALYNAGGGIRAVGDKYYAAYFPAGFASSARRRILLALHGTGGSPEAEFAVDWQGQVQARNWAYLGLKYLSDSTGAYDDETTIYSHSKSMVDEISISCDVAGSSVFLVGFSRGSAQAFPVGYLDLVGRRMIKAVGNNSGAWPPGGAPTPTFQGIVSRNDRSALSGAKYWMYCGGLDMEQGFPMCDAMSQAAAFVTTYGGTVAALYRDPTGTHGGLTRNSDALSQMFSYFESLP